MYRRSNLLYYLAKWSNLAIKYLRSKVVKFYRRIKNRLPPECCYVLCIVYTYYVLGAPL